MKFSIGSVFIASLLAGGVESIGTRGSHQVRQAVQLSRMITTLLHYDTASYSLFVKRPQEGLLDASTQEGLSPADWRRGRRFLIPESNNDFCGFFLRIPIGGSAPYDNEGGTAEQGEPSPGAGTSIPDSCESLDGWCQFETEVQNSVWFFIDVPPGVTSVTIETSNSDDLQLALWEISFEASPFCDFSALGNVEVAANDDSATGFSPKTDCTPVKTGGSYAIQLDGNEGQVSSGNIRVLACDFEFET
jgi:hypothetical protein